MKCHICDREDDLITLDPKTGQFSPCGVCEAVIQETLDGYEDVLNEDADLQT